MIPIVDVIKPRRTPWGSLSLIGLTVIALGVELGLPPDDLRSIMYAWGLIPEAPRAIAVVSSVFLTAGPLSASAHAVALWFFGPNVEDRFGTVRFLLLYVVGGAVGNLVEGWSHDLSPFPIVGASGSIGAIIGAYFVLFPTSRILFLMLSLRTWSLDAIEAPAVLLVGVWFLLQAIGADSQLTRTFVLDAPPLPGPLAGIVVGLATAFALRTALRMDWRKDPL
jgi:membrane associated rhomboid family serine protease